MIVLIVIAVSSTVSALYNEGIVVVTVAGSQSDDACSYSPAAGILISFYSVYNARPNSLHL